MTPEIKKYYLYRILSGLMFTYVIRILFLASRGITPTQLALFASLSVIFSTLLEIPTGFIADKFGKRYSVALSYLLMAIETLLMIFVYDFNLLVLIAFISGLSASLLSGAMESLVYENIGEENQSEYLRISTNGTKMAIGIGMFITFIAPILYSFNQALPFVLTAVDAVFSAFFIMTFKEKRQSQEVLREVKIFDGIKDILKIRPILLIVLIDLILLIFVNIYYQVSFFPKLTSLGLDVKYLGIVDVVTLLIGMGLLHFLPRILFKSEKNNIIVYSSLTAFMFLAFALSNSLYPALFFGMLFDPIWGLRRHIVPTITNNYLESKNRALSISSMSFISNLGSALILPLALLIFNQSYLYALIPIGIMCALFIFYPNKTMSSSNDEFRIKSDE